MKLFSSMLLVGTLLLGSGAPAQAQDYPSRPVQVLIGFPPGGSSDIVGRYVMQKMTDLTGNQFVVENRTGAGGNLAFAAVAAAKPDGYTLLFSTPGIAINPSLYKKVSYKLEDFTPIALVGDAPLVLLAGVKAPVKTVNELVIAGKSKPDAIRFASSGNGSSSHLSMDVLRNMTGMQYIHIPYRGGGTAMIDLMSGDVDVTMQPIAESVPYLKDPRVIALGQTGSKRAVIAPDIPTIEQAGIKGYASTTWYMLLGPANLPAQVVQYIQKNISTVLKMPEVKARLEASGLDVINGDSAQTKEFLYAEYKKWGELIKASGTVIE